VCLAGKNSKNRRLRYTIFMWSVMLFSTPNKKRHTSRVRSHNESRLAEPEFKLKKKLFRSDRHQRRRPPRRYDPERRQQERSLSGALRPRGPAQAQHPSPHDGGEGRATAFDQIIHQRSSFGQTREHIQALRHRASSQKDVNSSAPTPDALSDCFVAVTAIRSRGPCTCTAAGKVSVLSCEAPRQHHR
jgi:hypothetical protein